MQTQVPQTCTRGAASAQQEQYIRTVAHLLQSASTFTFVSISDRDAELQTRFVYSVWCLVIVMRSVWRLVC